MKYLLYSETSAVTLKDNLGAPEYSYFFVREYFRSMLEFRGMKTEVISDPEKEADVLYDAARTLGETCILLSFAPPHRTFLNLRCPTIPIFAWEFDTLPDEVWQEDERNDWRTVLASLGQAVTHSRYSADAIKRAMGAQFPVLAAPAPLFDQFASRGEAFASRGPLIVPGDVLDSRRMNGSGTPARLPVLPVSYEPNPSNPERKTLSRRLKITAVYLLVWYRDAVRDLLPSSAQRGMSAVGRVLYRHLVARRRASAHADNSSKQVDAAADGVQAATSNARNSSAMNSARPIELASSDASNLTELVLEGVVYTSVFNPDDGRKNWEDMLRGFCCALSAQEDATLLLKFSHADSSGAMEIVRDNLRKLPPFKCRVVALSGFLDKTAYRSLINASTYVVNSSLSEGQCLPLMEFMSCGIPAIAPRNTAMLDYIDEDVAFVVNSSKELCCWPHDPRNMFRAHRYRGDWQSLVNALSASYHVAKTQPDLYSAMSKRAVARMSEFCSQRVVWEKFEAFLEHATAHPQAQSSNAMHDRAAASVERASSISSANST